MENIYLDPLVLTVNGTQEYVPHTIEAVRFLKLASDPPPMTVVGLSNVSNSVSPENRSLINHTYLVMLMAAGWTPPLRIRWTRLRTNSSASSRSAIHPCPWAGFW